MNNKRAQILDWLQHGHINEDKALQSLEISQANNTKKQWLDFIKTSCLWLAVLSLASGVIFFFAYNWSELTSTFKFGILQFGILITTLAYSQSKSETTLNTALLFLLTLLIGALLALFGQTYQTGKDPWQLFVWWALLSLPFAYLSQSSSLWILVLGLANLALSLNFHVSHSILGHIFNSEQEILAFATLNAGAAFLFEFLASYKRTIRSRYAAQLAIVIAMIAFSWMGIYSIVEFPDYYLYLLAYLLWMGAVYYVYRVKNLDVMILSSWALSSIIVAITVCARIIDDVLEGGAFLLLGVLLIVFSTLAGKWLMNLLKQQKENEHE